MAPHDATARSIARVARQVQTSRQTQTRHGRACNRRRRVPVSLLGRAGRGPGRKGRWSWRLDWRAMEQAGQADWSVVCGLQPGRRAVAVARTRSRAAAGVITQRTVDVARNCGQALRAIRDIVFFCVCPPPLPPLSPASQPCARERGRTQQRRGRAIPSSRRCSVVLSCPVLCYSARARGSVPRPHRRRAADGD